MASFRAETYGVFGLEPPAEVNQPAPGKTTGWFEYCNPKVNRELETGQVLVNKRRVWPALRATAFINGHNGFFLKRLFKGDKMTFHFGFASTRTPYTLVSYQPQGAGIAGKVAGRARIFCGNTMIQRRPDTGAPLFLHRTLAKYKDAYSYLNTAGPRRAWMHVAQQGPYDSWYLTMRGELPDKFFVGDEVTTQQECLHARGAAVNITKSPGNIVALEDRALQFLADIESLPFYPRQRHCSPASEFLCQHP
jgi:hypothetical protein